MPPHGRRRRASSSPLSLLPLLLCLLALLAPTLAVSSVLGVDLGTEFIKAALIKPGIPLEIVLTKDSRRKEAAALAFKPAGTALSSSASAIFPERAYGADALALAVRFPGDVYPNLKPLLGLVAHASPGAESAVVTGYQARYPGLALQQCSAERATVCVRSNTFAPEEEPFAVEELLAMQLQNVRRNAEDMAGKGNTVKDVVITVPVFYTVEEKRAVETAAELAGLRVLALTTDGMAVGIHYATTRTFPLVTNGEKPEHHLVFDMGSGSTTATVMRFQSRSVKDVGKYNKTVQEIQVLGAGWDSTLGGDALNQLIMDDLVQELAASKPMQALKAGMHEIHGHGRTMAKLWKETQRLRQILSANTATQSNLEGLYNGDVSFKYKITRSRFEELAAGYETRVADTVAQALEMAKLNIADLDSVILHGGATRTPFVQKSLEGAVGRADLLKTNVNSDEAAAFGAAFRAAGISPSFRVKEIRTSEAAIIPVEMAWTADGKDRTQKLFVPNSLAGQPKQVPFKVLEDFSMSFTQLATGDGGIARPAAVTKFETTNLTAAVKELRDKYGCEAADVSTQFSIRINDRTTLPEVTRGSVSCEVADKKTAGVMDGVKNLFGFGSGKDDQVPLQEGEDADAAEASTAAAEATSATSSADSTSTSGAGSKKGKDANAAPEAKEPETKLRVVYVGLKAEEIGLPRVQGETLKRIQTRMKAFDTSDKKRKLREVALNDLESYTYKLRDLVEDTAFSVASTEKLRKEIAQKAHDAGEWIYGDGTDAKLEDFQARLKELQDLVKPVMHRKTEASQRDSEVQQFREVLNSTRMMMDSIVKTNADRKAEAASSSAAAAASASSASEAAESASASASASPDPLDELDESSPVEAEVPHEPFSFELPTLSEEQIADLEKVYEDAKAWFDGKLAKQKKLKPTEDPAFTIAELKKKSADLQSAAVEMLTKQMEIGKKKPKKPKKSSTKSKRREKKTSSVDEAEPSVTAAPTDSADASTETPASLTKDEL